jgi:hypothetical protein
MVAQLMLAQSIMVAQLMLAQRKEGSAGSSCHAAGSR